MTTATQLPGAEDEVKATLPMNDEMLATIERLIADDPEDVIFFRNGSAPFLYVFNEQIALVRVALDHIQLLRLERIDFPQPVDCIRFSEKYEAEFSERLGGASVWDFAEDRLDPEEEEEPAVIDTTISQAQLDKAKAEGEKIRKRKIVSLPKNLAVLGKVAPADGGTARFVMESVRLKIDGHRYRCEVTDGRFLAVVRGPFYVGATGPIPLIERAWSGDGAKDVLIGRDDWLSIFKMIPTKSSWPKIEGVALSLSQKDMTAACDGKTQHMVNVEGRFPEVRSLFKDASGQPVAVGKLGVEVLEKILAVAKGLGMTTLDVAFYQPGQQLKPFGMSGKNDEGQILDVLAMPFSGGK